MIEFLKSRKKYLLVSLVSTAGFLILFTYLSHHWMLVTTVNGQECFPYKHWVVKKTRGLHIGEFIAFQGYGIPNTPDKVLWGKRVLAMGGDRIVVEKVSGTGVINIDGVDRLFPIQGIVHVYDRSGKWIDSLTVYGHDTFDRPLPMIHSMVIPEGKYFVIGETERSYDSRYWGLVDASWVVGRAYPVI
jgi:type IV secretory pathway protease TraF